MPNRTPRTLLTPRDEEILTALDRSPLTVEQLLKLSATFAQPFTSDSRVRGRLAALRTAGWTNRWQYATTDRGGAPDYNKLTLAGYRLLYGADAKPPSKRAFAEIGVARQHHSRALADFIVHTLVAAHSENLAVLDFARENSIRLPVGDEALFPDAAFRLRLPDQWLNFFVELDNGTERIRSQKDVESWERKIRLYEAYQDRCHERFRVLVVTTRSRERLERILLSAADLCHNPQRSLLYGVHLEDFLMSSQAITAPCFRDHLDRAVPMAPAMQLPLVREAVVNTRNLAPAH